MRFFSFAFAITFFYFSPVLHAKTSVCQTVLSSETQVLLRNSVDKTIAGIENKLKGLRQVPAAFDNMYTQVSSGKLSIMEEVLTSNPRLKPELRMFRKLEKKFHTMESNVSSIADIVAVADEKLEEVYYLREEGQLELASKEAMKIDKQLTKSSVRSSAKMLFRIVLMVRLASKIHNNVYNKTGIRL